MKKNKNLSAQSVRTQDLGRRRNGKGQINYPEGLIAAFRLAADARVCSMACYVLWMRVFVKLASRARRGEEDRAELEERGWSINRPIQATTVPVTARPQRCSRDRRCPFSASVRILYELSTGRKLVARCFAFTATQYARNLRSLRASHAENCHPTRSAE